MSGEGGTAVLSAQPLILLNEIVPKKRDSKRIFRLSFEVESSSSSSQQNIVRCRTPNLSGSRKKLSIKTIETEKLTIEDKEENYQAKYRKFRTVSPSTSPFFEITEKLRYDTTKLSLNAGDLLSHLTKQKDQIQFYVRGASAIDLFREAQKKKAEKQKLREEQSVDDIQKITSVLHNSSKSKFTFTFVQKDKLIDYLVDVDLYSSLGDKFTETVLLTHKRFIKSVELLSTLFSKYTKVIPDHNQDKGDVEKLDPQRSRIMKVIECWMSLLLDDFRSLESMKVVLSNWIAILVHSKNGVERTWARYLKKMWEGQSTIGYQHQDAISPTISKECKSDKELKRSKKMKGSSEILTKLSHTYIACQMTILDYELFAEVRLQDFLQNWETNTESTLIPLRDDFNKIVQWLITEIVSEMNLKNRVLKLQKIIKVGETLLRLNNLNGLMKIYKALSSPSVARLHKTWKLLSNDDIASWKQIEQIMNPESNYKIYSNLIKKIQGKGAYVPCIYITLFQLEAIEDCPDKDERGNINFEKMRQLAKILAAIANFRSAPYNIERDSKLLKWLKDDLDIEGQGQIAALSRKCEPATESVDLLSKHLRNKKKAMDAESWFIGQADRKEAETILKLCNYNAFLVRHSSVQGAYALSFWNNVKKAAYHAILSSKKNGEGFFLQGSSVTYGDVHTLIENCPELRGFKPAWNNRVVEIKKRNKLPLMSEDQPRQGSNLFHQYDTYHRTFGIAHKFFSDNKYAKSNEKPLDNSLVAKADKYLANGELDKFKNIVMNGLGITSLFRNNQTLYHIAADNNNSDILQYILESEEKPDINACDDYGWTALHSACDSGNLRLIDILLRQGARINPVNKNGSVPLHYFVRSNQLEDKPEYATLLELILNKGASVNCRDVNLETPLHKACASLNLVAVKLLVSYKADVSIKNISSLTPMDICVDKLKNTQDLTAELSVKIRDMIQELSKRPYTASHHDIVVQNEMYIVDNGNESTERKQLVLEAGQALYRNYFHTKEHLNIYGRSLDHGVAIISIAKEQGPVDSRMLVRTTHEDELAILSEVSDPKDFVETLKELSKVEYLSMDDSRATSLILESEGRLVLRELKVPVVYFKDRQYTLAQALKNSEKDQSEAFTEFLEFFGHRMPAARKSSRNIRANNSSLNEYNFVARHQNLDIAFVPSTILNEKKKDNLIKKGLLVIFLESSCFDPAVFQGADTNVIIVVQPSKYQDEVVYTVSICTKRGIPAFSPMLPYPSIFKQDDYFKEFFLTKLVNGDRIGATITNQQKIELEREKELTNLYNKLLALPPRPSITPGSTGIKMYKKGSKIGQGATGSVYIVKHRLTKEEFCTKEIDKGNLQAHIKEQVHVEIALLTKLDHENIIKLYDYFDTEDKLHLILELCSGGSLQDDVAQNGTYSETQAARVLYQLLAAVSYIHKTKISHRDIKPDNILFFDKAKRKIKLIDFGFGQQVIGDELGQTRTGTFAYLAPEMASGEAYDYYKVDIWCCGCVAYFLLFGRPPFDSDEKSFDGFVQCLQKGNVDFQEDQVYLSAEVKRFIRKLLCTNPAQRATAEEALHDPWLMSKAGISM